MYILENYWIDETKIKLAKTQAEVPSKSIRAVTTIETTDNDRHEFRNADAAVAWEVVSGYLKARDAAATRMRGDYDKKGSVR